MPPTATPGVITSYPPASVQLRTRTRDQHLASEAAVDVASLGNPDALIVLLQGWAAVWQGVQRAAQAPSSCLAGRQELLAPAAQALRWLETDLDALATLPCRGDRPAPVCWSAVDAEHDPVNSDDTGDRFVELLARPSSTWGVAYVLRGSRLGGSVLAGTLSGSASLPTGMGTAFLRSAGTDPGREWVAFRRRLDALELRPHQLTRAVDAARWTFARVTSEFSACREHRRST